MTLVSYITRGCNHQAVLNFGATRFCGGAGINEGDGYMAIHCSTPSGGVSNITHTGYVGIDRLEVTLHAAAV